jgi:hypothetical protein
MYCLHIFTPQPFHSLPGPHPEGREKFSEFELSGPLPFKRDSQASNHIISSQ